MSESELSNLWNNALEGLDPRIRDALNSLSKGEITKDEYNRIHKEIYHKEIYHPTTRKTVLGNATQATFLQFLRGDISKKQLEEFVDLLNNKPDDILPGLGE